MSKVIATRIKNVLPSIIRHNQTGFIKDRYIGESVRSIFDIMEGRKYSWLINLYRFSEGL